MSVLDSFRYGIALMMLMTLPWAVLFWYMVHPFIGFWRRRGPRLTYTVLVALGIAVAALMWSWREPLMAVEFGTGPALWIVAGLLYVAAGIVETRCREHLKFSTLVGMPELVPPPDGGTLLQEGIYAQVRHPRYISITLGMFALATFCNYLALWVATFLLIPALFGVVLFEERELRDRFGDAYVEYSKRVPRFLPRFGH